jgi:hypothetical protein
MAMLLELEHEEPRPEVHSAEAQAKPGLRETIPSPAAVVQVDHV